MASDGDLLNRNAAVVGFAAIERTKSGQGNAQEELLLAMPIKGDDQVQLIRV